MNLITPLPDSQVHSNYHSLKYDRDQSRANKSSAGSNHDSINKHHSSCHQKPADTTQRSAKISKKKPKESSAVKVVTEEAIHPCPFQLQEKRKYD